MLNHALMILNAANTLVDHALVVFEAVEPIFQEGHRLNDFRLNLPQLLGGELELQERARQADLDLVVASPLAASVVISGSQRWPKPREKASKHVAGSFPQLQLRVRPVPRRGFSFTPL